MSLFRIKLREIMDYKKVNAYNLAAATNVTRKVILSYLNETKPTEPGYDFLARLSRHFKISPDYFFLDIPVERYYKLDKAAKKITSKVAMMPDNELDVFHKVFTVYAKHIAGKSTEGKGSS